MAKKKKKRGRPRKSRKGWTFKDWYASKGDALNQKRRKRYHTDPDYRERILAEQRERRKKVSKSIAKTKNPKIDGKRKRKPLYITHRGKWIPLFSVTQVMDRIGVTRVTLVRWIDNGFIPCHIIFDEGGRRWFPGYFVDFLEDVAKKRDKARAEATSDTWYLDDMKTDIDADWKLLRHKKRYPTNSALSKKTIYIGDPDEEEAQA